MHLTLLCACAALACTRVVAIPSKSATLPASHSQLPGYGQTNSDAGAGKDADPALHTHHVWSGSNRVQWEREMHKTVDLGPPPTEAKHFNVVDHASPSKSASIDHGLRSKA